MPGMSYEQSRQMAVTMGMQGYMAEYGKANQAMQSDVAKALYARGIQPGTPQWNGAFDKSIAALTAPKVDNLREGLYMENGQLKSVTDTEAGVNAIKKYADATQAGKNQQTLAPPDQLAVLPDGRRVPASIAQALSQARGGAQPIGAPTGAPQQAPGAPPPGAPQPQGVGAPFGQQQGAEAAQAELSKKYSDLQAQGAQAQTTNAYLQNIKALASKAAVGPLSEKTDFANGLLSYAGINKTAADAQLTANDLMDKYSNQIVARLSSGGLGTDAARSILQAAYPNSHMTKEAINEAVDNLVGANEMTKAKLDVLGPQGNARDPVRYQQLEQVFNKNADPNVYQYRHMVPGSPEAKAFARKMQASDPSFLDRAAKLHDIGAL